MVVRGGTVASAALHIILVALLLIPVGKAIESGLFERHLVYLIPPDRPSAADLEAHGGALTPGAPAGGGAVDQPTAGPRAERASPGDQAEEFPLRSLELIRTQPLQTESALTEIEVDSAVVRDPTSAAPEYPPLLLAAGVAGEVTARYVVDTLGVVDTTSFTVMRASRSEFADAVRRALPGMHFRPAMQRGRLVRQWVEQTFHFRIQRNPQ
jgi:TonB family protein